MSLQFTSSILIPKLRPLSYRLRRRSYRLILTPDRLHNYLYRLELPAFRLTSSLFDSLNPESKAATH